MSVERDLNEMITEIESIETMLKDLKANDENEFKTTEENAQVCGMDVFPLNTGYFDFRLAYPLSF